MDIVIELFDDWAIQCEAVWDLGQSQTPDRTKGGFSAHQLRGDEDMDLVDLLSIPKTAQQLAAAFDEDVRDPSPAQLVQQAGKALGTRVPRTDEHVTAGFCQDSSFFFW